jgi:DNA-binding CsgD family transcriptional regulator
MNEIGVDGGAYRIVLSREIGDGFYAVNQIDAARAEFHDMLHLLEQDKQPAETPYAARVRLHLCDLAAGTPLVTDDDADAAEWEALRRTGYGLTVLNTAHRRIQRDARRGRPDLCWHTVTSLGILPQDISPNTPLPHTLAVLAGSLFAGRQLDVLGPLLLDFRTRMDAIGHRFFKLHAHAMLIHFYVVQRQSKAALLELHSLLTDLEPGGFLRIVLDLPALHPLLNKVDTPFAARLAALVYGNSPASAVVSLAERRVLEQFAVGGSAAQIAERLHLSTETVRSHIKSIYAKLDAHDRAHAVERAREMGIL